MKQITSTSESADWAASFMARLRARSWPVWMPGVSANTI